MAGRNNIFAIDFDAVVQAIKDANENLAIRHSELMAARDRMPKKLHTNDEVAKAKKFAEHLKKHISLCRSTRLSDTKPLRELVKRVESYFKAMEDDAKSAQKRFATLLATRLVKSSVRHRWTKIVTQLANLFCLIVILERFSGALQPLPQIALWKQKKLKCHGKSTPLIERQ